MSERDPTQQAFDRFGRETGLRKKSGSWYRHSTEVISVSNLQRSQFGPAYYLNQAFWLVALGDEQFPKESKCHVRTRLDAVCPDESERLANLLDLDWTMAPERRIDELVGLLRAHLLPLIYGGETLVGLRAMCDGPLKDAALISGRALAVFADLDP